MPEKGSLSLAGKTVGFIGAGMMAEAIIKGLLADGVVPASSIIASDSYAPRLAFMNESTGITTTEDNMAVVNAADVVVLAVKPHIVAPVLTEIQSATGKRLVVSIAAGVTLASLEGNLLAGAHVIRVMPNTPALVGEGAAAFCLGAGADDADKTVVSDLLGSVCPVVHQVAESLLNAVTGLSGSGPAYVYQFIEALSDGGVMVGLPRTIATELAAQTVLGAAKMVIETKQHMGPLKDAVTSPGGTTIRGVHALESGGMRATVMNAVVAATARAAELGKSK